ncbi:MAG: class III extradiol ring-cleavage dioxygenase [Acidimicrobiales bacterium]
MAEPTGSILYLPHGGGPMPLMGDPGHAGLTAWLRSVPDVLGRPEAILLVSAHWEEPTPTVQTAAAPSLLFDYGGFPPETYHYTYPALGQPQLAQRVIDSLGRAGFDPAGDERRGFDHGMFVPMMLMYPDATVPTLQLSLVASLDPDLHLAMGAALRELVAEGVAVVGSGLSFHNMAALGRTDVDSGDRSRRFDDWLVETCTDDALDPAVRAERLVDWEAAPEARFSHPREEHLLPLHVCAGAAGLGPGQAVYRDELFAKRVSAILW